VRDIKLGIQVQIVGGKQWANWRRWQYGELAVDAMC